MRGGGRLFVVASMAAGVVVVVVVARRLGADLSAAALALPVRAHMLALAAFAVDLLMRALRVVLLARGIGVPLSLRTSVGAQVAGDAAGAVTPSRVGCDPAKLFVLGRDGVDVGAAAAIMVGEILAEVVLLLAVAGIAAAVLPAGGAAAAGAFSYAVAVIATTSSAILLARTPDRGRAPALWRRVRLSEAQWLRLRATAARFLASGRALLALPRRTFLAVAAVTLTHMVARLAVLPLLLIGQVPLSALPALLAWPMLLLYAGALVPVPGGGGAIELGFATTLDDVLSPALLVGALVWWRLYTYYLSALLGGIALVFGGGVHGIRREP